MPATAEITEGSPVVRTYRRTLRMGYAFLVVYLLMAALSPLHVIEAQEVFPFFSWSLFSSPKSEARYYSLLLDEDRSSRPAEPPPFATQDGRRRLIDSPLNRHISLTKVLASYSREASESDDPRRVFDAYRPQVDAIVGDDVPRYHLFETVYNPIQLFVERRYRRTSYIGTYDPARDGKARESSVDAAN